MGRPLGWIAAWLALGNECLFGEEHRQCQIPTLSQRQVARAELSAVPGAADLFAVERPKGEGEGGELLEIA